MTLSKRIYTAGRADFEEISEWNCIYVDKTDLVYEMTHESQYKVFNMAFFSKPLTLNF